MYKLTLKEANGREAVIYFTRAISLSSSANGYTYVRDEIGTTWQTEESVDSLAARIDAVIAAK